ncbi:MAG: putative pyridoxal-dependent aspartate 1-decarboxylase [Cellvibrionales bacterium]|nr:putative pyridoxal-dependent aspartate 1-decarboxylase [Cellvibrionales bacterium]
MSFFPIDDTTVALFTAPISPDSPLSVIDKQISGDIAKFLNESIARLQKPLADTENDFSDYTITKKPRSADQYTTDIMEKLVSHSANTASPGFIGHMTSALPSFLPSLAKLQTSLNQNVVKLETSNAFTSLEQQVIGMMHHLIYEQDSTFYQAHMHNAKSALGVFCSGGTVANITALWAARNRLLPADDNFPGIVKAGLAKGLAHYNYDSAAILISEMGHYSIDKTADLLGIGRENVISIETDAENKVCVNAMRRVAKKLQRQNTAILAIVGIAGSTETGHIDPLEALADLAEELQCHFHVDAAWGGAALLSENAKPMLKGIERADSVTIDAHKQMYAPMGAGMVFFKDPQSAHAIQYQADYIIRGDSQDLGRYSVEGSRAAMALLTHACLEIIGLNGYQRLIDSSIDRAHYFANLITQHAEFELLTVPELCLLTYRYTPKSVQQAIDKAISTNQQNKLTALNQLLDELTAYIQDTQRKQGKTFVSRTRLKIDKYHKTAVTVFRVVLANPLTTKKILTDILDEQEQIAKTNQEVLPKLLKMAQEINSGSLSP